MFSVISGLLYDQTHSYTCSMYMAGGMLLLASALAALAQTIHGSMARDNINDYQMLAADSQEEITSAVKENTQL